MKDGLLIGRRTDISPEHYNGLAKLTDEKRKKLLFEPKMQLINQRAGFKAVQDNLTAVWRAVEFTTRLLYSKIDKASLLHAIEDNFRCTLVLAWTLQHHFGSTSEEQKPGYVN